MAWRDRAAHFFFMIIIFGMPLFSVPCFKGRCAYPMEVIADYLYAKKLTSDDVVKGLVYPNSLLAMAESMVSESKPFSLPSWKTALTNRNFARENASSLDDATSMGLLFVLGCLLCVVGALASPLGPSIFSTIGILVVFSCVYFTGHSNRLLSTFVLAVFCSVLPLDLGMFLKRNPAAESTVEAADAKKSS